MGVPSSGQLKLRGNGDGTGINEEVFGEVTYHAAYEPKRTVRTQRWRYIRRFDLSYQKEVLPNCDESPCKIFLREHTDWAERQRPSELLYDLLLDPQERNNLAELPEYDPVLNDLRARLQDWMIRTDDPLLQGDILLPPEGTACPQDAAAIGA